MMTALSKKSMAARLLAKRQAALFCPICHCRICADDSGVTCAQGHRFDLSKKGTVCLMRDYGAGRHSHYDAALFASRRWAFAHGYFAPLVQAVLELTPPQGLVVDLGCGEGSLVHALAGQRPGCDFLGLDIAREGVRAGGDYTAPNALFAQADVARLPLADDSAQMLINMLTPAAYGEFYRVLAPGGSLVKIAPTGRHLAQLRRLSGRAYEGEAEVFERFGGGFSGEIAHRHLEYTLAVPDDTAAAHITQMSPLAELLGAKSTNFGKDITFSFNIYMGRKGG